MLKHVTDKAHLVTLQELVVEQVAVELDSNLFDLLAHTFVSKPTMLQVRANQYHFEVINFFKVITDYSPGTFGVLNKVELKLLVIVQWKVKNCLNS